MTLFDIVRNLQAIAAQEPSVRSVSDGDIYDALNAAVDIKYGVFHITQDTHTTNGDLDQWGLNLFYIDRLLDNGENRLSIQSAGITILENVLKRFADAFGAEYLNNIVYTPFTQRFKDNCAGVFCKISISTVMDNLCEEGGKIVLVKNQDKSIDITSNGRYNVTPDYGFSGLGMVDINVDVQGGEPIEPKLQSKKYDITENGTYTVLPDEGYDGLERVDIFAYTGSRCDSEETYRTYTRNGTYEITPSNPDYFIRKANVTVNVPIVLKATDDTSFANSRYSSFPVENYDFSEKTDYLYCWTDCRSLQSFPYINTSKGTNFVYTWSGCSSITEFPLIDTAKGVDFYGAWKDCKALTSFPLINTSNGTDFERTWYGCSNLISFPQLDLSKGNTFKETWYNCDKLTDFQGYDLSNSMNFYQSWYGCTNMTTFDGVDLSSGTNFYAAWFDCNAMHRFAPVNMNNATNLELAWYHCYGIAEFPMIDTSKVTNFNGTWEGCMSLRMFPQLDLSAGTDFNRTWADCSNLTDIPYLDLSSATHLYSAFYGCRNLVNLGGFGAITVNIDLSDSTLLTVDSIVHIINQAADLTALGITGRTMTFGNTNLNKLTDEQKSVATRKGWELW